MKKQAQIDIFIFKAFLKILVFGIIGLLVTTFIDDVLILANFIVALYAITIIAIIIGIIGALILIIKIATDIDFHSEYKDEIYDQIFNKNNKKYNF